jgi:hypothetical protein
MSLLSRFPQQVTLLALGMVLMTGIGCSKSNPPAAPAKAPAAPASAPGSASMFEKMGDKQRPLPGPPADEAPSGPGAAPQAQPALTGDMADSPECKALAEEEKGIRAQLDQHNKDVVGPASERSEAAYDEFSACQDDPTCMNNLAVYSAKQSAYNSAKRAEEAAEKQGEAWETRLHEISQKQAANCNTDPL